MKTIITTGNTYVDIDALACAIAYRDFLKAKNVDCEVVFTAQLNETVSKTIKSWELNYKIAINNNGMGLNFVIVDCANPKVLPEFVRLDKTLEVYDHHFSDESELWNGTGAEVKIEKVGACATLIWEKIRSEKLESKISQVGLDLLYIAIFANTLNFESSVTTERDKKAFQELKDLVSLDEKWIAKYYQEIESSMLDNPKEAIKNDTKILEFPNLNLKIAIGQIELWNSKEFISKNENSIIEALESFGIEDWFFTSPSISEGKNYIYTQSPKVSKLLEQYIGVQFKGNWGETDKLWLRKEILRKLLEI